MDILLMVLKLVIMIVVPVATSLITYYIKKYANKLISKIDDEKTQEIINQGVDIITDSVNYVQQTYVDELKKEDKFTIENQKVALEKAKDKAIELMNDEMTSAIAKAYGNIDTYVETIVESVIQSNK